MTQAAAERADVSVASGGETLAAWLHRPVDGQEPGPCVVMAGGFTAVREQRLDAFAQQFAAAGLTVLLFDYRHFGASTGEPRQLLSIPRQLEDWRAAIAHARALPEVDPDRVALWGSSFSGGHVVELASRDPKIAAVVSQAPFTDGLSALRAVAPAISVRLTIAALRDALGALAGRDPVYLPAVGNPGEVAAMTAPEAKPGFEMIDPPGSSWENRFVARAMLRVATYRPYARFAHLRCPVLAIACDGDATTPPEPVRRAARRSPNAELAEYEIGHFEVYVEPAFDRVAADQVEFLTRNLLRA